MKLQLIVNPRAGSGRAARRIPQIERALAAHGIDYKIALTERPHHATELARQAHSGGFDCIAVVGGDGTVNEIAQSYLDSSGKLQPGPDLALLPAGTGGDFRKTFGLADEVHAAVTRLHAASPRRIDLGRVELTTRSGAKQVLAFINIMSFGMGGLVDELVNDGPKWLGGKAAFLLASFKATLSYRNPPISLAIDGKQYLQTPILNVAICNGRFFGGGMQVAPEADPSDGLFDIVAICDLTRAQGVALARHIYQGSHLGRRGIQLKRGQVVEAHPLRKRDDVLIDLDGETPGKLPLRAEIIPGALRILA
jgi:YegS/Rv2252/BmrU family lipid kinase